MSRQSPPVNDVKLSKAEAAKQLLSPNSNIVGVGIGKKVEMGKAAPEDCVRIYVVSQAYSNAVPSSVLGVPTEVIEVGNFGRKGNHSKLAGSTAASGYAQGAGSPIRVKTNAPNVNEGVRGTLGAVVTDGAKEYLLSCNHLLARNRRVPMDAVIVSAEFVGTETEIARPAYFVELNHSRGNSVDCALAELTRKVPATFPDGVKLASADTIDPRQVKNVTKFGAVTHRTSGTIVDTDADLYIDYRFGTFLLEHQIMIDGGDDVKYFATSGDSGSVVVDEATGRPTALIFAASGRFAVASPLDTVLTELAKNGPKLKIVPE